MSLPRIQPEALAHDSRTVDHAATRFLHSATIRTDAQSKTLHKHIELRVLSQAATYANDDGVTYTGCLQISLSRSALESQRRECTPLYLSGAFYSLEVACSMP